MYRGSSVPREPRRVLHRVVARCFPSPTPPLGARLRELGALRGHVPGRGLVLETRVPARGGRDNPARGPHDGPGPDRGRAEGRARPRRRQTPPPGHVRVLRGGALLQVQRVEADLVRPHPPRRQPEQRGHQDPAEALRGRREGLVREPPAAEPGPPDQAPEGGVRAGRDVQPVAPRFAPRVAATQGWWGTAAENPNHRKLGNNQRPSFPRRNWNSAWPFDV